jgi:NADH-quinone oxidoreductase subunit L
MELLLHIALLIPVVGFLVSLLLPRANEKWISWNAFATFGLHLLSLTILVGLWLLKGRETINIKDLVLVKASGYEFYIDFLFDGITVVFAFVGAFLTFLVAIYSRVYLHRENGYKRFYNTIHMFFIGYALIIFSGNMETLFTGWEILGMSSFMLIAFYRHRYLPVRNAVKVFSIYRLGDVGLILAMWLSHDLWHENITFIKLNSEAIVSHHLEGHTYLGVAISLFILLAALVKSAQLPFSSWLPRAMEGPTPSSAIFYGSLSVHLGVFLLMRTYPFWEHQLSVRILIGAIGMATTIVASSIARVQSAVKSQIAYASIAQIGLIFIELACGGFMETVALFHFAGNAFLRTYQLLVSPSVVSYLIREQFYNFMPKAKTVEDSFPKRIQYSFYMLSLKEWNLDSFVHRIYRAPIKKIGKSLSFLNVRNILYVLIPSLLLGFLLLYYRHEIPDDLHHALPLVFSALALLLIFRAYVERKDPILSWMLVISNHVWIALAISFNEEFSLFENTLYLSGILLAGALGLICLLVLKKREPGLDLDRHQGHAYEHNRMSIVFFLACLGLIGFPITPSFIAEDLIFTHIHENQYFLAVFVSLSLVVDGLAIIRLYSKIFLGTHIKTYHERAYKSS